VTATSEAELERELERLYQLPLSEFTSARNALAKRLRSEGDPDRAEQVKQLRKPPVAAWLVNRLARERELDVQRLVKAGEALTKSQVKAAAGHASQAFLDARREEHRALERLGQAAREIVGREGVGASAVDRATETLRAASLTDEGRELLKRGRLTKELQPPGFEALTGLVAATPRQPRAQRKTARKGDDRAERRREVKEIRERVRQLRAQERQLVGTARTARREAERAEAEAARLRRQAEEAEAEAEAAARSRQAVERELERLS